VSSLIFLLLAANSALAAGTTCYSPSDCATPQYCSSLEDGVTPGTCLDPVVESSASSAAKSDPGPVEFKINDGTEGQGTTTSASSANSSSDKGYFIEKQETYNQIGEAMGEYLDELGDATEELGEEDTSGNAFINFFTQSIPNYFTQTVPNFFASAWCVIFGC